MHGGVWFLFNDVFYLRKNVWSGSFDNKKKGAGHRGDRSGDSGQWQRVRDYFKRMILCARKWERTDYNYGVDRQRGSFA